MSAGVARLRFSMHQNTSITSAIRLIGLLGAFALLATPAWAQLPDKVGSLLAADRAAARVSVNQGAHAALQGIVDQNSVFFTPDRVNAVNYLRSRPNIPDVLRWETNFCVVAKSMEWGVTSGPMTFQRVGARQRQGEYLTIWKRDRKGNWKVELRAEIEHKGTNPDIIPLFFEPQNDNYVRHRSKTRLAQRDEIIKSNEELFSSVSKSSIQAAYNEFLADDARLLYPWQAPIVGKKGILGFLNKQNIDIVTESEAVSRAYSGEWAYSYGTAMVHTAESAVPYRYVRIWKMQDDYQWHIQIEMLFER